MAKVKVTARRTGQPARFGGNADYFVPTRSFCEHSPLRSVPLTGAQVPAGSFADFPQTLPLAGWIRLICEICARGANDTLKLARLMSQARRALPYGGWGQLWRAVRLPFSKRKGEMLVVIGECVEGLDAQNSAQLPMAWNTLYYLARLGRVMVERLVEQGRIHPGLSLREAQTLLAEHHPARCKNARSKLRNRLANLAAFIRVNAGSWSWSEQEFASRQLSDLAGEIRKAARRADIGGEAEAVQFLHLQPIVNLMDQPHAIAQTP
jgi:hypothetical protein